MHKDYLGSILAISDEAGNKLEQRHYDAWGIMTHLQIGNGAVITDDTEIQNITEQGGLMLDRGYTSHEHLWEVKLIHMNGRLYDPLLRRFLNADENIQDPHNTQNYNKYGYVMNNPLMFNDPSGESFLAVFAVITNVVSAVMGVFQTIRSVVALINGNMSFGDYLKSSFFNVISNLASFGLGELFKAGSAIVKTFGDGVFLVQAAAHSISQGVLSVIQGQDYWQGAAAGFIASLASSGAAKWIKNDNFSELGTVISGAIGGGIGSALAKGNFWRGVEIGGSVAVFNHSLHNDNVNSYEDQEDPRVPVSKKRIVSTDENHTLKGRRGNTPVTPFENQNNKVGAGPPMIVPNGNQSMVTADITYYSDNIVNVDLTISVRKMNTTGSYMANYHITNYKGKIINNGAILSGNNIGPRQDFYTIRSKGSAPVLSTVRLHKIPIKSIIKINVGLYNGSLIGNRHFIKIK